jgi:colicin import membrane protein
MWKVWKENFKARDVGGTGICVIEALEDRAFLSAAVINHAVQASPDAHAAAIEAKAARAEAKAAAKAARIEAKAAAKTAKAAAKAAAHEAKIQAQEIKTAAKIEAKAAKGQATVNSDDNTTPISPQSTSGQIPDCVGQWTGTLAFNTNASSVDFSVDFTSQKGVALTGTFDVGALGDGQILTTVRVDITQSMLAMVQAPNATDSFVGAVANNGTYIIGRWSRQTYQGAWETGTFIMKKS